VLVGWLAGGLNVALLLKPEGDVVDCREINKGRDAASSPLYWRIERVESKWDNERRKQRIKEEKRCKKVKDREGERGREESLECQTICPRKWIFTAFIHHSLSLSLSLSFSLIYSSTPLHSQREKGGGEGSCLIKSPSKERDCQIFRFRQGEG